MNDSNNLNDLTKKMEEMNKLMEANLFNNPLREINENFRKDLLEFREIFLNNLKTLEVTLENNYTIDTDNISKDSSNDEIDNLKKIIEKKDYQLKHLKTSFDLTDKQNAEAIEKLTVENTKLKYRQNILLKTIESLENKNDNKI